MQALYERSFWARQMNALVAQCVQEIVARAGPYRGVRILEVGAGTGGTTSWVLERTGGRGIEYTFTDISGSFTRAGQERFGAMGVFARSCSMWKSRRRSRAWRRAAMTW